MDYPKLFMVLLGSKAPGRNVEQHDYFFGIAAHIRELIPQMRAFWPEAGNSLHIDGWREVTNVDGYRVSVIARTPELGEAGDKRLFFINLGGYTQKVLEEQHYTMLGVHEDRLAALKEARKTGFFKTNSIQGSKGANSHIDDKYGIDVDELYQIEDLLAENIKTQYSIRITAGEGKMEEDIIHLGYFKLDKV